MGSEMLDYVLKFLNIDKKDYDYHEKLVKMRRAEKALGSIVSSYTGKANRYLGEINAVMGRAVYPQPVNLSLQYYRDPGKVLNSFIAMEYTICGNINTVDDNTKAAVYRTVIPDIMKEYNKTNISSTVKIKEGSMFNATIILYQE